MNTTTNQEHTVERTMTKADRAMLALLTTDDPQRASELGAQLWGTAHRKPQDYARPAGRILARLSAMGHARMVVVPAARSFVAWLRIEGSTP